MLKLYKYHKNPEKLYAHDLVHEDADFVWATYSDENMDLDAMFFDFSDLEKYEKAIAKSAEYSYLYAANYLDDRFVTGEPAIAQNAYYAFHYAVDIMFERFRRAEPLILNSTHRNAYLVAMERYGDKV